MTTPPANSKTLASALRELAADPTAHATSEVFYQVGSETLRHGKTTVRVRGDGDVTVSNRQGKNERSFRATLPLYQLKEFLNTLVEHNFTEQRSARATGDPGEARMTLRLQDSAAGIDAHSEMWDNERWQNPDLKTIVTKFQALLKDVSKGAIRF